MEQVFEYAEAPTGTVHLIRQDGLPRRDFDEGSRTLCGRRMDERWTIGDETTACTQTSCTRCLSLARPDLPTPMRNGIARANREQVTS